MADVQIRIGDLLFEWDDTKANANVRKHGVSFVEAATTFGDLLSITIRDPKSSDVEERFLLIGESIERRILIVVHVVRDEVRYRMISARPATRRERQIYEHGEE